MTRPVLILRPEPGAGRTGAHARGLGLEPVVAPIFTVESLAWEAPPPAGFEAVILTSAHAARLGGAALAGFAPLPCYAVGEATAAAADLAGFADIRTGPADGSALIQIMAGDGVSAAFHPHGRDHIPLHHPKLSIESRAVYASHAAAILPPEAVSALRRAALVLLHSPRAASHFARLFEQSGFAKDGVALAALSEAVAMAAGPDWKSVSVAAAPRDEALLELAAKLCKTGGTIQGKVTQ